MRMPLSRSASVRLFSIAVVFIAGTACSKSSTAANAQAANTQATSAQPAPAGAATAAPAPAAKPIPAQLPEVVARVNGEAVDKAEFEKAIKSIEERNGSTVPADQRDRVYRSVLDQIIGYKLLVQESKARNVTVPDTDIDARIAQIRGQFPTEEAFKQTLEQQHMTVDQLRADARSEMLVTKMLQSEVESKVSIKPEQVADFYQKNPDRFKQAERVRASHILISVPRNADAAAKQTAKTKAEGVLKEVKAGKDFAALAKQYSEDPGSAQNGGDLNFFGRGQMVGPFDQAVFAMTPGQTSDLVETQFGYHIIKLTEKQPSRTVALDEVRPQIQQFLENQARQDATQKFVESLKAKGKVEILI
jgi:peptidyl-prolyl cis-trans isomerase C